MNDLQRQIDDERARIRREQLETLAWIASSFTRNTAAVDTPTGALTDLVIELLPLVPARFWQKGMVGTSPDGRTRVTVTSQCQLDAPLTRAKLRDLKRAGYLLDRHKKCRLFVASGYTDAESFRDRRFAAIVMLHDARAAYRGRPDDVKEIFVRTIATNDISEYGLHHGW